MPARERLPGSAVRDLDPLIGAYADAEEALSAARKALDRGLWEQVQAGRQVAALADLVSFSRQSVYDAVRRHDRRVRMRWDAA